jgi:HTH-type transcriptional regulator/antitoxin HipB
MKKKNERGISLDEYLKGRRKNREFRIAFDQAMIHLELAHMIGELRKLAGITQTELARQAGVSQPMIARLERGDQDRIPTLSTLNKVLNVLGREVELVVKEVA